MYLLKALWRVIGFSHHLKFIYIYIIMIIPSQNVPLPEYPLLHVHVKLPKEFAQVDCS